MTAWTNSHRKYQQIPAAPPTSQQQDDWEIERDLCDLPIPPGLTRCEFLEMKIAREMACIEALEAFDAKYTPGRHTIKINEHKRSLDRVEKEFYRLRCNR